MTAPEPAPDATVVRHPRRGRAHRMTRPTPPGYGGTTACGAWAARMTEHVPLTQVATEDLCRKCWPTEAP